MQRLTALPEGIRIELPPAELEFLHQIVPLLEGVGDDVSDPAAVRLNPRVFIDDDAELEFTMMTRTDLDVRGHTTGRPSSRRSSRVGTGVAELPATASLWFGSSTKLASRLLHVGAWSTAKTIGSEATFRIIAKRCSITSACCSMNWSASWRYRWRVTDDRRHATRPLVPISRSQAPATPASRPRRSGIQPQRLTTAMLVYIFVTMLLALPIVIVPGAFFDVIGLDGSVADQMNGLRWVGAVLLAWAVSGILVLARPEGRAIFVTAGALQMSFAALSLLVQLVRRRVRVVHLVPDRHHARRPGSRRLPVVGTTHRTQGSVGVEVEASLTGLNRR